MLVGLPLLVSGILLVPGVQTKLVRAVTNRLSSDLSTEITIERVAANPFSGIQLTGFLMKDHGGDTLFYAPKLKFGIESLSLRHKHIYFGNVCFSSPQLNLHQLESDNVNLSVFVDSLSKFQSDSVLWHYSLKGLILEEGSLNLRHKLIEDFGIDSKGLMFSKLNLRLKLDQTKADSLFFRIDNFSAKEENGLIIDSFKSSGLISNEKLQIYDLMFKTVNSAFDIDEIELSFNGESESGFSTPFKAVINDVMISTDDIRLYKEDFPHIESPIHFSGLVYGSLDNLKGRDFVAGFGSDTKIVTSFDINGLSNFYNVFVYLNIEHFQTTIPDLELLIPGDEAQLPASFLQLETIRYKGNITGFIDDMVAYGSFTSKLGEIKTDIGLKIEPGNQIVFSGELNTSDFQMGTLLNMDSSMGEVSMDVKIDGERKSPTDYHLFMDGLITSMEFYEYHYHNILVQGLIRHQMFDGRINVDDPYGSLDFIGKVDASQKVPSFNFNASVNNIHLDRLKFLPDLEGGVLSVQMTTDFEGDNLDDLVGEIMLFDGILFTPDKHIDFDSISIKAIRTEDCKRLVLESPFVKGEVEGQYSFRNINQTLFAYLDNFLPSFSEETYSNTANINDFDFDFDFIEIRDLLSVFFPDVDVADKGYLKGHYNHKEAALELDGNFDFFNIKKFRSENFNIKIASANSDEVALRISSDRAGLGKFVELYDFSVYQKAHKDTLTTNLLWNNWEELTYSGAISATTAFSRDHDQGPYIRTLLHPSNIIVADTLWKVHESSFSFHPQGLSVRDFRVEHFDQFIALNGFLHREADDGLTMKFSHLDISEFLKGSKDSDLSFAGTVNGELQLKDYYRLPLLTSNLNIAHFNFNGAELGLFEIKSSWNNEIEALEVKTSIVDHKLTMLQGGGLFSPKRQYLDFRFFLDSLNIEFLNPFIENTLQNVKGCASGEMFFSGPLTRPFLTGRVKLNDGRFDVDFLNTSYTLVDSVYFHPKEILFNNLAVKDYRGSSGSFSGSIFHSGGFKDMIYNLQLDVDNMLLLDTRVIENPHYYGRIFGSGLMQITGNSGNVNIDINARTRANTQFFIPVQYTSEASESNFIRFVGKTGEEEKQITTVGNQEYTVDLSGSQINMDIEVTPDAEVQIIFDERIGDILRASGAGNLQIGINRYGNLSFFGDYTIQEGYYLFSLQNLINKRFSLNEGGTVKWQGDPYNADIDITAIYRLRASLNDLLPPGTSAINGASDIQRRVQILCNLYLQDRLQQPAIRFGLEMPTLDESRESLILDYISSEEEMNRQVLSLLVLGRFYTPDHLRMGEAGGAATRPENTALLTTSEMLSSQVSRWFSNISNDIDVGFAYRPGDELTSEEFELALSTQVFNNRVTINGNVGYGKYYTNTSKMVGDFDVDVKLNTKGTIRARAYTRSNEDLIYETAPTTQGIGLSFKEEFNEFRQLIKKYWQRLTGKKK